MRTTGCLGLALALAMVGCGTADDDIGASSEDIVDGFSEGSPEALAVLALVNDPEVSLAELDDAASLDKRAAQNIIAHRDGADATTRTDDDDLFETVAELDAVSYVGQRAFDKLLDYAEAQGYLADQLAKESEVIFSPQPYENSHNVRVRELIDGAVQSIDVAMYSFSDAEISAALDRAVQRGVQVRFMFETANADRRAENPDNTKSGNLEEIGVDVRYVNKIMHHKFMIVDGPRDDGSLAKTARLATGSGNWSWGAATIYDENTLFMKGYPELAMRMQDEFNHMWAHSRDFSGSTTFEHVLSTLDITNLSFADNPGVDALFTSFNFDINEGSTTFKKTSRNGVSDALVAAIQQAEERIHIASGHFRLRPVAEALIQKRAENPDIDIVVYLDSQEYISEWWHNSQVADLDECLAEATTETQIRNCTDKGFLFGYQLGQSGIDVIYKYYAYRWHYSYAPQMHHKFLIIDDALYTGSYNLSDNAERNTFENITVLEGPEFKAIVDQYEAQFQAMLTTGDGLLPGLQEQIQSGDDFPIVFAPMALRWQEITDLKDLIEANCPALFSAPYKDKPESHKWCDK